MIYRVVMVDDENSTRVLLPKKIKASGLNVEVVGAYSSAAELLDHIEEVRPHIVFVDMDMPIMNGVELTKIIVKKYPEKKVVMLTALDSKEDIKKCLCIGLNKYLNKPINQDELYSALEDLIVELAAEQPEEESDEGANYGSTREICEFIKKNYSNQDLNLTMVAKKFSFNASYVSRKFKSENGLSFVDYVTKCRMEAAMEYLRKKKPMYEAAMNVGIPDPNYFSKCFKKFTGKSYTEMAKEEEKKNVKGE